MNRLHALLKQSSRTGEKLLSIFVTAGFPEPDATVDIVRAIESAGADFIELGIPFSDPIADGPTIQAASHHALENGMTLKKTLTQLEQIRLVSDIPILLMGYFNPLYRYGLENLVSDAESAGADGFIIPDLLPEDSVRFSHAFRSSGLGINFLVSPNTSRERLRKVDEITNAFIYCVSAAGVTGMRRGVPPGILTFLQELQSQAQHPFLVGFGISNGQDAAAIARHCHGVIVGSAVINRLADETTSLQKRIEAVSNFVSDLKQSLKGVSHGH